MPDANDRIPPVFFNAEAYARVFGAVGSVEEECEVCGHPLGDCEGEDPDCPDNELEIVWEPDPSLDGAHFTAGWS